MLRKTDEKWSREEADSLIRDLHEMDMHELRVLWAELFGNICYSHSSRFVRRRLEWRINTLVSGGISERALKRAEEIMDDTLLRVKVHRFRIREDERVPVRQTIRKLYHGEVHEVHCSERGIEYRGRRFRSLSAVATHIAGYHVSCTKFFGVYAKKARQ